MEETGRTKREQLEEFLSKTKENIHFVYGKGKHKTEQQRRWDKLDSLCQRWKQYDQQLAIMGEGRKLYCRKVSTEMKDGIPVIRAWYRCGNCQNCPKREKCCRKQDKNAPKEVIWKESFWERRRNSLENITSEHGIELRMNRSIQV